jgi:hypothetical protein
MKNACLGLLLSISVLMVSSYVIVFDALACRQLNDYEMAAVIGGQTGPGWCRYDDDCRDILCPTEPCGEINEDCGVTPQTAYTSKHCSTISGDEYCTTSGTDVLALCVQKHLPCRCNGSHECVYPNLGHEDECEHFYPGTCLHSPCIDP